MQPEAISAFPLELLGRAKVHSHHYRLHCVGESEREAFTLSVRRSGEQKRRVARTVRHRQLEQSLARSSLLCPCWRSAS